jgi:hypothetical protein
MTRINLIPPRNLSSKHLVAEYREIARVPQNLRKSLSRKTPFSEAEIPPKYVLGKGHVKFFYDKMFFLADRFDAIVKEMLRRGYNPQYRDSSIFLQCDDKFKNNYEPDEEAIELNVKRIKERS